MIRLVYPALGLIHLAFVAGATAHQDQSGSIVIKSNNPAIYAVLTRVNFEPRNHKVSKLGERVIAIDGEYVMGTDGAMPEYSLSWVKVFVNGVVVSLDTRGCFDPWVKRPPVLRCVQEGNIVWLYGRFSDGAGTYVVGWQVRGGQAFREIFSDDEAIIAIVDKRLNASISR